MNFGKYYILGFVKQSKFQCPISRAEFNGSKGFLGNWNCGHVITDTVIKELSTDKKIQNCPVCHAEYKEIDLIRINPIHPDHLKQIKHQFHLRRKQRHLKAKLNRHYKKVKKKSRKIFSKLPLQKIFLGRYKIISSRDYQY